MAPVQYLERARASAPRLAYSIHSPQGEPRAFVVLNHGYAEHMQRYGEVVRGWNERGLLVATFDHRGHGLSEGPRGHVVAFRDYVDDLSDLLAAFQRDSRTSSLGKPILFGHSMGALIAAHAVLAEPERFRGLAVTSPFWGLQKQVHPVQRALAGYVNKVLPGLRQPSGLKGKELTHDTRMSKSYDTDPLHFGHVTVRWFLETQAAQEELLARATEMQLPLFGLVAGDDRVASVDAARRVFAAAGSRDKELVVLDGLFHEVLNEIGREAHIATLAERMLRW